MAVIANQFNPNDQDQNNGQGSSTSQPVSISGSEASNINPGPSVGSTGGPNTQANSPKPTSSGRFQDLNSYLKANQNFNQQNGGLAGQINQNLGSKANDLQKNFAQAKQDYQTSLDNARQRYDSQFVNNTVQNASQLYNPNVGTQLNGYTYGYQNPNDKTSQVGWYQNGQAANSDQTNSLNDAYKQSQQSDLNRFNQMRDATYAGPTQLDPSGTLQAQAQNFGNLAGNVGSEQGRFSLLQQLYNKPTYTTGQRTLDNLFLQNNPTQLANLQNNKITANQLNSNLGQAQADATAQAANATNEANATQQATRAALANAIGGFDTQMGQNVQNALSNRDAAYQNEISGLQNQGISSADALKFGLIKNLGDKTTIPLYNLDPTKYLSESTYNPTNQTVANANDYSRIQALGNLAGGKLTDDTSNKILDAYGNPSLAGTFSKQDPYNFNNATFTNDLNNAQVQYQNAYNPQKAALDAAVNALNGPNGFMTRLAPVASDERQNLQKLYDQQAQYAKQIPGYQNTAINPQGMSDLDILKATKDNNPYSQNNLLISGIEKNQQQQYNAQQALQQLMNQYGANKTINITDANKYQPTQVATNPLTGLVGSQDINSPTNQAANSKLASLNKIYNRV